MREVTDVEDLMFEESNSIDKNTTLLKSKSWGIPEKCSKYAWLT